VRRVGRGAGRAVAEVPQPGGDGAVAVGRTRGRERDGGARQRGVGTVRLGRGGHVGRRRRAESLARVHRAGRAGGGRLPGEGGVGRAAAGQLQGPAHRRGGAFADADVGRDHPGGRAVQRGERALVAEELHDLPCGVHQRETVGAAVLHADEGEAGGAEARQLVGQRARQVRRVVERAAAAVVADDFPAGQRRAGRAGDLDEFAAVGAVVVVVEFVDPDGRVAAAAAGGSGRGTA